MKDYSCDLPTLKRAVDAAQSAEQEISLGNETRLPERECYKLTVKPDKMQAYAKFFAASVGGEDMTVKEMLEDLEHRGVKCGIKKDVIEAFLGNGNTARRSLWRRERNPSRERTLILNINLTLTSRQNRP